MKQAFNALLLFFISFQLQAQDESLKTIKNSLKTGKSIDLVTFFNTKVEIAFDGNKRIYTKTNANKTLQTFFSKNTPKDFQLLHHGESKDGIKFYIGELETSNGVYRILIYLRVKNKRTNIETLDISKE